VFIEKNDDAIARSLFITKKTGLCQERPSKQLIIISRTGGLFYTPKWFYIAAIERMPKADAAISLDSIAPHEMPWHSEIA